MKTPSLIDLTNALSESLSAYIPDSIKQLGEDSEKQLHAVARDILTRLDCVSREEFDVQTKVLARTRQKLQALEKRVSELESR